MVRSIAYLACGLLLLVGCTTTTVTKNPDDCDRGIRYYRPKPYLLIQPATASDEFVSLSLEYLPDFSEEYSIRVRAGLGVNQTKIVLKDGWNLTQIDQKLDSQTDENIRAVADLIGSLPIPTAGRQPAMSKMVVRATNVPLGFYESIISRGPDGKKGLFGWRYVGFHPFNACPIESAGSDFVGCSGQEIYGLVFERGVMKFKLIGQIEPESDFRREIIDRETVRRLPALNRTAEPALTQIRNTAVGLLRATDWGSDVLTDDVVVRRVDRRMVVVTVRLKRRTFSAVTDRLSDLIGPLETALLPDVRHALLDDDAQVRLEIVPRADADSSKAPPQTDGASSQNLTQMHQVSAVKKSNRPVRKDG
ncbi:MAG: hypothetical protein ACC645_04570 [Pirellulales bacterium]